MVDDGTDARWQALVNDERARRAFAEQELADVRRQLSEARKAARSRRSKRGTAVPPAAAAVAHSLPPAYPAVRAVVGDVPDWVTSVCDTLPFDGSDQASLAGADLVILGGDEVPTGLQDWLGWEARQPLIAIEPQGDLAGALGSSGPVDLLVGESSVSAKRTLPMPAPAPDLWPERAAPGREEVAQWLDAYQRARPRQSAQKILKAAGVDVPDGARGVTAVVVTKRPGQLAHVARTLGTLGDTRVAVGTHGFEMQPNDRDLFPATARIEALAEEWPLGKCMNHLLDPITTPFWAKIDDDDFYGPRYMDEAVAALEVTGADLVGKHTHFLYDGDADETYLMESGNEHYSGGYVTGPTLVGRRRTWEVVPFAHRFARIDSTFVRGVKAVGLDIHATSRFEFALGRGGDSHTWHVDRSRYLAKGRKVGEGLDLDQVFLPS